LPGFKLSKQLQWNAPWVSSMLVVLSLQTATRTFNMKQPAVIEDLNVPSLRSRFRAANALQALVLSLFAEGALSGR
jgi:hypothetical protein